MRKLLIITLLLCCGQLLRAQEDSLMFTPEYLDTVVISRVSTIND